MHYTIADGRTQQNRIENLSLGGEMSLFVTGESQSHYFFAAHEFALFFFIRA